MKQILYFVASTVRAVVIILQLLMLARAIISWLPLDEDNPIENFLYTVTEPVIAPVRALLDHFGWFEDLPIDMAFFITFFLLAILGAIL